MTILESFDWSKNGRSKHPWDEWLDGQIRALTLDDFGKAKPQTIMMMARNKAKKMGKKVRLAWSDEKKTLVIQAYVPEPEEQDDEPEEPTPAKKPQTRKKGASVNGNGEQS